MTASRRLSRRFTTPGTHPYEQVEWERRDPRISNYRDGTVAFEQLDVEVPAEFSANATNILAQKYFRGPLDSPDREHSLRQVADRVADTITGWGLADGHFADQDEADTFRAELQYLIITQAAAFNSPVWFNIGVPDVPQQASACFILAVDDTLPSILNWYAEEASIFKGGSGAGINLSAIRSSAEPMSGGGTASGPVTYMRPADASAGTIKSGGKTRRAAKMVILNIDHPDIEQFVACKMLEERKARVLADAGFDMGIDGIDAHSIQYQNANNSVRVTDEFMQAVVDDIDWHLRAVTTGAVVKTVRARDLMRQLAEAAWECADPGMQFDTTINRWNTAANTGRINGSNPCSEHMHLDNSACNLASFNLMKFLDDDGVFDAAGFCHAVDMIFTAQDILVGNADYPTERIGANARAFRQLGIGYANLGALLMALGVAYDSDEGRAWAASITALLTGAAYRRSVQMAEQLGPFDGYKDNAEHVLRVLGQHRDALAGIDADLAPVGVLEAARLAWDQTCAEAETSGVRNSQASVLAPAGTIGLLMDCDTTGIEPDLGLVKTKTLVGGGTMTIVNRTVPRALRTLGYTDVEVAEIADYIDEHKTIVGAPHVSPGHTNVFACSMGDNAIHYSGHVRMMAAVQPFLSGAISKTVNMPADATIEDVEQLHIDAWRLGVKSVAIYRDGSKVGQPLTTSKKTESVVQVVEKIVEVPTRHRLPHERSSRTVGFEVGGCKGFLTAGEYPDGRLGEVFIKTAKQGSTLSGIMDSFAMAISHALQYGVPLATFVETYQGMKFEPAGMTNDPDIRIANSLVDYLFRKLAVMYLSAEERAALNILTTAERTPAEPHAVEHPSPTVRPTTVAQSDGPLCLQCGVAMQRAGSCFACPSCGSTSGCS